MEKVTTSPDAYIKTLAEGTRQDVQALDKAIAKVMKGETRTLWKGTFWGGTQQNIIAYGDLIYKRPGKEIAWFKVGLGPQKNYLSVYVVAVEDGKYLAESYKDRLGKVKVGRSSISFKTLEDVNMDALLELIAKAKKFTP